MTLGVENGFLVKNTIFFIRKPPKMISSYYINQEMFVCMYVCLCVAPDPEPVFS